MDKNLKPVIVVRRKKAGAHPHHGGAWKIAYADFVTAMMAFFLLMWLLGSTTQGDLNGISEYFKTPLKVALAGGSGSGDSSSVIKGGGQDLTRSTGQVKRGDTPASRRMINLQAARAELQGDEMQMLKELQRRIAATVEAKASLRPYRNQLRLELTSEGLRIQLVDEQNRPMFDMGRAALKPHTRELLRELGAALNSLDNKISLAGHTDAAPYAMGDRGYSNWELSADRANASRRELVAAGIAESKIVRVVGLASSVPLIAQDVLDPANRRISIVVLNRAAEEALMREAPALDVGSRSDIEAMPELSTHSSASSRAPGK